jgi:predicted XRE-type DNA-binding protein
MTADQEPAIVEASSGNIFADLELPDAGETMLKSQIVVVLHRLIKVQGLTQSAAAKRLGIGQPDLSHILRGNFRGWSVERLMRMLNAFEQDVEITVKPHDRAGESGSIRLNAVVSV